MRRSRAALALLGLGACTDATLFGDRQQNPPDKLVVEGSLCTDDPSEREFPVKVLFLVDTSIADGDYISLRGDSIQRLLRAFGGPNYTYSVIRYAGPLKGTQCGIRNLTPDGYTKTLEEAVAGVRCADVMNPGRDLMSALSLANSFITGDVLQTDLGRRSRTKYVVVVLANGPPSIDLSEQWCNSRVPRIELDECDEEYYDNFCGDVQPPPDDCERYQYVRIVRDIRNFAEDAGAQETFMHVVYQRDPDQAALGDDDPDAIELYADIALHGGGNLYRFPGAATCDVNAGDSAGCLFSQINLDSTEAVFMRRQLIASNRSAKATGFGLVPDTDGDGLTDEEELTIGTDPTRIDTDGDTLGDRLEHLLRAVQLDPLRNDQTDPNGQWPVECPLPGSGNPNAFLPELDRDGDGLTDCEEILLKSDPTLFDSDSDGVPDPLELAYGTNIIDHDAKQDKEADGFANIDEFRYHLDPLSRDASLDKAYRYSFTNEEQRSVVAFTQPHQITGVEIIRASAATRDGRATVYYDPPPDPSLPVSETNPAGLSFRDPQDIAPSGMFPGQGDPVTITADGRYVLHSKSSNPLLEADNLSIEVDVITEILPRVRRNVDVRMRSSLRFCFDFKISNIQLVDTLDVDGQGLAGLNFIDIYLSQVPTNNPTGFGVFRAASVLGYLDPVEENRQPQPTLQLFNEDFLLFGE